MKKEKSPVLVIFCIFMLSLFIILPPLFRATIPKTDNSKSSNNNITNPKLTIVSCNRIYDEEMYQVVSRTKFVSGRIETNTIRYQKITELPEGFVKSDINPSTTVSDDLNLYSTIQSLNMTTTNDIATVILNQQIVNEYEELSDYFQSSPKSQKNYYESIGYQCNVMES